MQLCINFFTYQELSSGVKKYQFLLTLVQPLFSCLSTSRKLHSVAKTTQVAYSTLAHALHSFAFWNERDTNLQ